MPQKPASPQHKVHKPKEAPLSRLRRYFERPTSIVKAVVTIAVTILTFLGAWPFLRPRVSVDPDFAIDSGDPFTTQFLIKNENAIFAVRNVAPACVTVLVDTDHNVRLEGLPPLPPVIIPKIPPEDKSTVICRPWISGFGKGAGKIVRAYIVMNVSYRQDWWPGDSVQVIPFKGVIDSQNVVHWTHRTLSDFN